VIKKLGTIDCDMVETTPVVFERRLYRFEYVRQNYYANKTGASYFRFVDIESERLTTAFATGHHFGSAFVSDGAVLVYGVDVQGGPTVRVFRSEDLRNWCSQVAFHSSSWSIFNNSVCRGSENYVMAVELDKPPEEVGVPFTIRFLQSEDLLKWRLTPADCVFSKDRYTACPALRFLDGYYYMIYLEARPGPTYEPHVVRSEDLVHWESSPFNPVMHFSEEDKKIANPDLTKAQRDRITKAVNINNSDVDLCEFDGKTIIFYSWGNQKGIEFLAEAIYDGGLMDFLRSFFP